MGRVRNSEQVPHRAGPLVQANKKHKAGKHRTKGMLEIETRGRVPSTGSIGKRHKQHVKRSARRKQAVANRDQKIQETIDKKRQIGGMRGAPICIALIPLSSTCNANVMLQHFVQQCQGFATVIGISGNSTHIKLNNGKNVTLVLPPRNDFWAVLDTLKLCDVALFLLPILDSISAEGIVLLKCAKDQGLPTPFLAVSANFSKSEEKAFLKSVHRFLPVEKIYPVVNAGQISNLFRMITVAKMVVPKTYSMRPGMIIESCQTLQLDPAGISNVLPCFANDPSAVGSNLLEVTGYIRRRNLNPHHLVHISGSGTYRILRIDVNPVQTLESMPKRPGPDPDIRIEASISDSQCPPRFMFDPAAVPPEELGETDMNADDMSVASDDLGDEYDDLASQNTMDTDEEEDVKPSGKRLPKGTSDYQADWLIDSDSEKEDKDVIGSDEELESEGEAQSGDEDESGEEEEDEMDWMEEQEQLKLAKAARSEAEFPDWVDTPLDTPAKTRFQRYRGLQSFKTSAWDTNENLPKEYSKICQFQNYRHTYKVVVRQDSEDGPGFIPVGQRVTMILKPADDSAAIVPVVGQSPLVSLISLLTHENKISVLNLHLNLNEVIKNKETIIFQVGFHRFRAKPILSEVSTGNKHKMLRYAQENMSCMATVFGPIVFPIASVLAFKASESSLVHAGSGALFSIDPSRLIIKRVLLSGYPFRSHGRKSTVRFMFFNRKDIEWFKPIELKTRYGRRGHIREALGTHGHMKCIFDGPMKSQDTVLMPLYKRVFPKWNYEPNVPPYFIYDQYEK